MLDYAAIQVSLKGWMRTEPATEKELEYAAKIPPGMYEVYSNKLDVALDEARTVFCPTWGFIITSIWRFSSRIA